MPRSVTLSVLQDIRIASPCPARWEDMRGDDRVRSCDQCNLNVFNIAEMTREEAEELVRSRQGRLCAQIYRRADGTIITRDCPVGLARARRALALGIARIGTAVAAVLSLASMVGARSAERARLRAVQPFASICEWISPNVLMPPPTAIKGEVAIGKMVMPPSRGD